MLVLLPPSEGKTGRARGRAVVPEALSFPELTQGRLSVLEALEAASLRPDAGDVLGVPPGVLPEVHRNTRWRTAPAVPVEQLYSGVLYEALGLTALPTGARRRAGRRVLVVSAAWGLLRPADRVAPYRLSMDVVLPGLGGLAAFWRPRLQDVVPGLDDGLVVDLRSSTYAAAWRPVGETAERTVGVQVLRESGGRRTVVSHMAKHTRGLVARALLLRDRRDPRSASGLASVLAEADLGERFDVELGAPARDGRRQLDVVLHG